MWFSKPHPFPERGSPTKTVHVGTNMVIRMIVYNLFSSHSENKFVLSKLICRVYYWTANASNTTAFSCPQRMSCDNQSYPVSECGKLSCFEGHADALLDCKMQYIWCSPGKNFSYGLESTVYGMRKNGMYKSILKGILSQDSQNFGVAHSYCSCKELPLHKSSVEDVRKSVLVSTALQHKKLRRNKYCMSIILLSGWQARSIPEESSWFSSSMRFVMPNREPWRRRRLLWSSCPISLITALISLTMHWTKAVIWLYFIARGNIYCALGYCFICAETVYCIWSCVGNGGGWTHSDEIVLW